VQQVRELQTLAHQLDLVAELSRAGEQSMIVWAASVVVTAGRHVVHRSDGVIVVPAALLGP
jgi:hypothetical protein